MIQVDDQNPVPQIRLIWNRQQNPPQTDLNNIKLILASTKVCRENIESICQFDDQLRNNQFSDIFYSSPLFDTYIQDLLYKAVLIQYDDHLMVVDNYKEILRLLQRGQQSINYQLKDIINYHYLLIGNRRNGLPQLIQQINQLFDDIFIDQLICPSQVLPVFKQMDLFQLERYDLDQEYQKAYSVLKENTSQGLRDAVLSLLRTGIFRRHQFQTRLVNIFTNMKFKRIKINHLNLRFIVTAKPANNIIQFLSMKERSGKLQQAQKEYLQKNSLIVVTNQFYYSYFELHSVKWQRFKPYLELKALDINSVLNFIKIINNKGQTIILESQSSYYQNQDYLKHLIRQYDPPLIQQDIQSYLVNPPNIINTANNNNQQIIQIVQQINLRFNVVFKCPGTNEGRFMRQLIERERQQNNKILIICQSNVVRKYLFQQNQNVEFIKKIEGRGIDQQNITQDLIRTINQLLYQMIIPDYEITQRDLKSYSPQIYNKIISQYCLIKRLSLQNLCENCKKIIIEAWLNELQLNDVQLQCRCNITRNQNLPRWLNRNQDNLTTAIRKIKFQPSLQSRFNGLVFLRNQDLDDDKEYDGNLVIQDNNEDILEQFDGSSDDDNQQSDQDESDSQDSDYEIFDLGNNMQFIPRNLQDDEFLHLYQDYTSFVESRQYYVGFQFDQKQLNLLNIENAFTWQFGRIDREQIFTHINYQRFLQLEMQFRFYYQKLAHIQQKNNESHANKLFQKHQNKPILASSILNMKSYLNFIESIGSHTLIIYGANRYAQGHLHSYIYPNTKKIILIGDENHIDTSLYIQNDQISQNAKSHFKLISLELQRQNAQRLYLTIQNNATTNLYSIFDNFYKRIDDQNGQNQEEIKGVWSEIQFVNHQFPELIHFRRYSITNPFEADIIQQFAQYLVFQGNEQSDIFIITFSHQQKKLIKYLLSQIKLFNIEVGTPQAFDGRYNRIIIVSMVRSNQKLMLGQLRSVSKLVSAFTTSQQGLFVFGDFNMIDQGFDKIYNTSNEYTRDVIDQYQDMMAHLYERGRVKNFLSLKIRQQRKEISSLRQIDEINIQYSFINNLIRWIFREFFSHVILQDRHN